MLEGESPRTEIALIRKKLETIDARAKSVVAGEEAIQTALSTMGEKAERYFGDISYGLESGLEGLAAAFEWGLSQIVYHLELQNEELQRIVEILEAPLETQAKELRRRAEFAHSNGWIDEALADFLEAEKKNYADFTIHQSLGNIYLGKNDLTKAQEYFEKAVKYARPHSSYYTAYAFWHLGRVRFLQGNISAAYEATEEAIRLQSDLVQALYDHAKHCALLMKQDESMSSLRKAIEIDRNYSLKALTDESFAKVAPTLGVLLEALRQEAKQKSEIGLKYCGECLRLVAGTDYEGGVVERALAQQVRSIGKLIEKESYFEFLDGAQLADESLNEFAKQMKTQLKSRINSLSQQIQAEEDFIRQAREKLKEGPPDGDLELIWGILGWVLSLAFLVFIAVITGGFGMGFGAVPVIFFVPLVLAFLISYLVHLWGMNKHSSEYQPVIQSHERDLHTLQNELTPLNNLRFELDNLQAKFERIGGV